MRSHRDRDADVRHCHLRQEDVGQRAGERLLVRPPLLTDSECRRTFAADLHDPGAAAPLDPPRTFAEDRKSTRLNSSHRCISYAVFCLKKKNAKKTIMEIFVH